MVPIARKMIIEDRVRFIITITGIGICIMLMLFLFSIYEGVKRGAISYVTNSPADIWVCQKNANNLLRSSSFLDSSIAENLKKENGVKEVTSITRFMVSANINGKAVSMVLYGFDPESDLGKPINISEGSPDIGEKGIIIDRSLASKYHLSLSDTIRINETAYIIKCISEEMNAIVAQFSFIDIREALALMGVNGVVSFFMIKTIDTVQTAEIISSIRKKYPSMEVYGKNEFIENNLQELEKGLLPVLLTIAIFSIVSGIAVITLMLYNSIIEKREDYALLKALGAGKIFLLILVLKQSFISGFTGFLFGFVISLVIEPVIILLVPEITLHFSWIAVFYVMIVSIIIGCSGTLVPLRKITKIYPAEVFRA